MTFWSIHRSVSVLVTTVVNSSGGVIHSWRTDSIEWAFFAEGIVLNYPPSFFPEQKRVVENPEQEKMEWFKLVLLIFNGNNSPWAGGWVGGLREYRRWWYVAALVFLLFFFSSSLALLFFSLILPRKRDSSCLCSRSEKRKRLQLQHSRSKHYSRSLAFDISKSSSSSSKFSCTFSFFRRFLRTFLNFFSLFFYSRFSFPFVFVFFSFFSGRFFLPVREFTL